ncbi:MAG TPA: hypothetical protein VJ914_08160 [Pseudonocardiaceae bacterium]|nr:hypothetical protein [Pseudonocardiaceae bacterium]
MRVPVRRALTSVAAVAIAFSACLFVVPAANAAPAAPRFTEIGAVPVPNSVRADLTAALAKAQQRRAAQAPQTQSQLICYAVSISNHPNDGWTSAECNSTIFGDYHNQIEAIEMVVSSDVGGVGYDTHIENIGWQGYRYDGAVAGTVGHDLRMEALRAWITGGNPNNDFIVYNVYLPDEGGWQYRSENGQVAGTTGLSEPITALWIDIT